MVLLLLSFIRTIVPVIVGQVMGFFTAQGIDVDPQFEGALTAVLGAAFAGLYYLIVRVIEMKFPQAGILLGYAKSPDSYSKGPGVEITKPAGNPEITVSVQSESTDDGTTLNSNPVIVQAASDRVPGPDHRAE